MAKMDAQSFEHFANVLGTHAAGEVLLLAVAEVCGDDNKLWGKARSIGIPWQRKNWTALTKLQMQYNDGGALNGGVVYYEKTTGKVIMGQSSNGFSSKLLIHDGTLNAYTDLASVSSYHLHISGSSTNGKAMGIGFGKDSSGVGGAVLFEDTGHGQLHARLEACRAFWAPCDGRTET